MYEFVYVGKIPSLRQVLLNSRLHFSLVTLAEAFSISRTDFRCCDGSRKMREPRDPTDMLKWHMEVWSLRLGVVLNVCPRAPRFAHIWRVAVLIGVVLIIKREYHLL